MCVLSIPPESIPPVSLVCFRLWHRSVVSDKVLNQDAIGYSPYLLRALKVAELLSIVTAAQAEEVGFLVPARQLCRPSSYRFLGSDRFDESLRRKR